MSKLEFGTVYDGGYIQLHRFALLGQERRSIAIFNQLDALVSMISIELQEPNKEFSEPFYRMVFFPHNNDEDDGVEDFKPDAATLSRKIGEIYDELARLDCNETYSTRKSAIEGSRASRSLMVIAGAFKAGDDRDYLEEFMEKIQTSRLLGQEPEYSRAVVNAVMDVFDAGCRGLYQQKLQAISAEMPGIGRTLQGMYRQAGQAKPSRYEH